jgi:hypothetical protein
VLLRGTRLACRAGRRRPGRGAWHPLPGALPVLFRLLPELPGLAGTAGPAADVRQPSRDVLGGIANPHVEEIAPNLGLLPGDVLLSGTEQELSLAWATSLGGGISAIRAFGVTTAFSTLVQRAAAQTDARIVLVDVGPNLGAINRAVMIASDHVVIPLAPDLYSLQGLRNLGPYRLVSPSASIIRELTGASMTAMPRRSAATAGRPPADAGRHPGEGDTRERILDIALDLFTEQGYDKTSLRQIAEPLGFTQGSGSAGSWVTPRSPPATGSGSAAPSGRS